MKSGIVKDISNSIMNEVIKETELTPERHEDSIEYSAWMIKQVADSHKEADIGEKPVLTTDVFIT